MRTFALLLFCSAHLSGQAMVSFSPGAKLSRGIYRWSMTICAKVGMDMDSGWIYQAAQKSGIPTLSVSEAIRLATRARNRDPLVLTLNGMNIGTQMSAYLVASGSIKSDPKVAGYPLLASGAVALAENFLKPQLPPDYAANLLQGPISLAAGGCLQRDMLTRTMKNARPVGPIDVP